MTDDAECLRRYAESRDENAFAEFVRRNVDFVYSAAFRQAGGDGHLAEDISQKVFIAAAQKAAVLGRHPVVAAWLHQTTRYAAIDAVRSRRRREARELAAQPGDTMSAEPEAPVVWEQVSPELDKIIASLGERDRAAVLLRFFGGKSFADIGAQLQLSEGAARMRVERALEKLRSRLARVGVTSSSAALAALVAENGMMAAPAGLGSAAVATAIAAPMVGGLAASFGILFLMTSAKITLGIAAVVTAASIAVAVHEFRHASVAEQALADSVRPPPIASPTGTSTGPLPVSARVHAQSAAPNGAVPTAAAHAKNPLGALLQLLDNPAMQKQNAMQAKLRLDGQYSALFKALALTPDQVDAFKNLLVEKQMVAFDSMSAAHQQGIEVTTDPKAFFQVVAEAQKTVDAQISALLGPDAYSQFQQYQTTVPARNTMNLLEQALSYTATPLTEAESASVIQLLSQYGVPALPPGNPFAVMNGDLGVIKLSDNGIAQLQGVLSPPQFQALQTKIQQQFQLLQARERMGTGH